MTSLTNVAAGLGLVTSAWYLPGRALLGPRRGRPASEHRLLAWAVGCAATSLGAFTFAMLAGVPLTRTVVLGSAVAWLGVGLAWWRWRERGRASAQPAEERAASRGPYVLAAVVFAMSLARFHTADLHFTCENYPTALALGLEIGAEPRPPLLHADFEQRLGTSAVVAPTVALLGMPGFRIEYAWVVTTIVITVAELLFAFGASSRLAMTGGVLAFFCAPIATIGEIDPNLNALAWLGIALLSIRPRVTPRPCVAGLALGLVIGRDPILAPSLVALGLLACHGPGTARRIGVAAATLLVACVPWAAHQLATYGALLSHPSLEQFPKPLPHAFLGVPFAIKAALNWPFVATPVRSPFNPFPSALMYVQRLGAATGAAGIGLIALGVAAGWRRQRALAAAVIFASLPPALALALVENWTEPTRLWLLVCVLLPVLVFLPLGIGDAWHAVRARRIATLAAAVLVAVAFRAGVGAWLAPPTVPVDERLLDAFPGMPRERPEELAALIEQYAAPGWLPTLDADWFIRSFDGAEWRTFAGEIARPSLPGQPIPLSQEVVRWIAPERYARQFAAPFLGPSEPLRAGAPASLAIDLTRAPTARDATALRAPRPDDPEPIDLAGRADPLHVAPCVPAWNARPVEIYVVGRTDAGRPRLMAFAVERDATDVQPARACAREDLVHTVTVPADTGALVFYVRQVLPTVVFELGARVGPDGVVRGPGFQKI